MICVFQCRDMFHGCRIAHLHFHKQQSQRLTCSISFSAPRDACSVSASGGLAPDWNPFTEMLWKSLEPYKIQFHFSFRCSDLLIKVVEPKGVLRSLDFGGGQMVKATQGLRLNLTEEMRWSETGREGGDGSLSEREGWARAEEEEMMRQNEWLRRRKKRKTKRYNPDEDYSSCGDWEVRILVCIFLPQERPRPIRLRGLIGLG